MSENLNLYLIRTQLEQGGLAEFKDFSWKNPLIVELEEVIHLPEKDSPLIIKCSDISGISALVFFWNDLALLLSEPILLARLPFEISICSGKMKIQEDGTLRIDAYLAVFEKNVHVNANAFSQNDLCEMITYLDNYIDEYQTSNFNMLLGNLLHDYLSIIFSDKRIFLLGKPGLELRLLIQTAFEKSVYNNWEAIAALGFDENEIKKHLMDFHMEREFEFVWNELLRLRKTSPNFSIECERMMFSKHLGIQGRADRLIFNMKTGTWTVIETKTGSSSFSGIKHAGSQAKAYALILEENFDEKVDNIIIEYPKYNLNERYHLLDINQTISAENLLKMRNNLWATIVGSRPELGPYQQCAEKCFHVEKCQLQCYRHNRTAYCSNCLKKCKFHEKFVANPLLFELLNGYYTWFLNHLDNEFISNFNKINDIFKPPEFREMKGNAIMSLQFHKAIIGTEIFTNIQDLNKLFEPSTRIALNHCPFCKTKRLDDSKVCKCGFEFPIVNDTGTVPKSILLEFVRKDSLRIEGSRLREGDYIVLTQQEFAPMTVDSLYGTIKSLNEQSVVISVSSNSQLIISNLQPNKEYCIDEAVSNAAIRAQKKHLNLLVRDSIVKTSKNIPRLMQFLLFQEKTTFLSENSAYFNPDELKEFDESQREAIKKGIFLDGILLIQGPPGTGKSTVIAQLVGRLLKRISNEYKFEAKINGNQKINKFNYEYIPAKIPILVTAYTNKAVENLVLKIKEIYPDIRLVWYGKNQAVASNIIGKINLEAAATNNYTFPDGSTAEVIRPNTVKTILERIQIVCATSTMAGSALLQKYTFHTAIIDEAGQITEPSAIIPLVKADNYILVGDHMQLPPISAEEIRIKEDVSEDALNMIRLSKNDTLSTSIFERLSRGLMGTDAFVTLQYQYRMNHVICNFSSQMFYNGIVKSGVINNRSVGDQTLEELFKKFKIETIDYNNKSSSGYFFNPKVPLMFINTEDLNVYDSTVQSSGQSINPNSSLQMESIFNTGEAKIIVSILRYFFSKVCEIPRTKEELIAIISSIGVISGFRAQNQEIKKLLINDLTKSNAEILKRLNGTQALMEALIIDTVDRFQGQEREIILFSCVDSNPNDCLSKNNTELRRMNVSITRAKKKLIFVGDARTLSNIKQDDSDEIKQAKRMFKNLVQYAEQNNGLIRLT